MQLENKYLADYSRHSEQIKTGLHSLNAEAPFVHDVPAKQATLVEECAAHEYPKQTDFDGMGNPTAAESPSLQSLYRNAFCDVVTESRFDNPGNISEKVLQSIQFKTCCCLQLSVYNTCTNWDIKRLGNGNVTVIECP